MSKRVRSAIGAYMKWKYEADKNLVKRTAFKWIILRPGGLTETPGVGTASIGRTHLGKTISVSSSFSHVDYIRMDFFTMILYIDTFLLVVVHHHFNPDRFFLTI